MIPLDRFDTLDAKLTKESENYSTSHPNRKAAGTLLSGAERLSSIQVFAANTYGDYFDDAALLQHLLSIRAVNALYTSYILAKNHCYDACHSRIRYLIESYVLLRYLNEDEDTAAEIYDDTRAQVKGFSTQREELWERLEVSKVFEGTFGQIKGEELDDSLQELYGYLSRRGSHPQTIRSANLDRHWRTTEEYNILGMNCFFLFGLACRYAEIFRHHEEVYWEVRDLIDPIITGVRTNIDEGLPVLFSKDIDKWAPER